MLSAGIVRPTSGVVRLHGRDVSELPVHLRAQMGVARTFQVIQLFPQLSVFDNLLVATHLHNATGFVSHLAASDRALAEEGRAVDRVRRVVELLDLEDVTSARITDLPFGVLRMVEVARAMVTGFRFMMLDEPASGLDPTSVEATSTPWGTDNQNNPVSYPLSTQIVYKFPARASQPPVTIIWNDGGLMPPRHDLLPEDVPIDRGGGVMFIGEKGILVHRTYGANPKLYPASLMEEAAKVPKTYPRIETSNEGPTPQPKHRMNWANAIRGRAKNTCPFEYAGRLTETMLLGVVAMRTGQGRRIYYDGEAGKITNVAEANQYLQREYRKGWSL